MTSETFGFCALLVLPILQKLADLPPHIDVGVIYLQKGMELLIEEFKFSGSAGYYSIVIAMLFVLSVYFFERTATLGFGRASSSPFAVRTRLTTISQRSGQGSS